MWVNTCVRSVVEDDKIVLADEVLDSSTSLVQFVAAPQVAVGVPITEKNDWVGELVEEFVQFALERGFSVGF